MSTLSYANMPYIYLHTADMDEDRSLYSFTETNTVDIQNYMKEAIEECDRITQLRRREMNTYEDDDMYDEIKNWMVHASEELTRRGVKVYTKPVQPYLGGFPSQTIPTQDDRWDTDTDDLETFTLPPAPVTDTDDDSSSIQKKNSLPTPEEYNSMDDTEKSRWKCLDCSRPALEGSAIPGSFCSSACALTKYAKYGY